MANRCPKCRSNMLERDPEGDTHCVYCGYTRAPVPAIIEETLQRESVRRREPHTARRSEVDA